MVNSNICSGEYNDVIYLGLVDDQEIGLDLAALRLSRLDHPKQSITPYLPILSDLAESVSSSVAPSDIAIRQAMALAYAFTRKGFQLGSGPEVCSSNMMRTIGTRCGNSISMAVLYVSTARRAGLCAEVLELTTGIFVVLGAPGNNTIIDFRPGCLFQDNDASASHHVGWRDRTPLTNRMVLVNLLGEEAAMALSVNDISRAIILYKKICIVMPGHVPFWKKKAELEISWGDTVSARESLYSVL